MLRIVKLNLYNYKLFKEMNENWSNFNNELDQFFNEILKIDLKLKPVEIIQTLKKKEKNRNMEVNPGVLYFLFDTTENAFVSIARVSFIVEEDKNNKNFNIELKVCPKYKRNSYEKDFIELLSKMFFERNKTMPIFKVNKDDIEIINSLILLQKILLKDEGKFLFYK